MRDICSRNSRYLKYGLRKYGANISWGISVCSYWVYKIKFTFKSSYVNHFVNAFAVRLHAKTIADGIQGPMDEIHASSHPLQTPDPCRHHLLIRDRKPSSVCMCVLWGVAVRQGKLSRSPFLCTNISVVLLNDHSHLMCWLWAEKRNCSTDHLWWFRGYPIGAAD